MRFSVGSFIVGGLVAGIGSWLVLTGLVRSALWMKGEGNASWLVGVPIVLFFAAVLLLGPPLAVAIIAKLIKSARAMATFAFATALQAAFCALSYSILARTSARHVTWAIMLAVVDGLMLAAVAGFAPVKKLHVVVSREE